MTVNDLPLLDLFTRLREAGLPLGVDEYQLLLSALQAGFGIPDHATLARLCQTLWVKSAEDARKFNYHFKRAMIGQSVISEPFSPPSKPSPTQPEASPDSVASEPVSEPTSQPSTTTFTLAPSSELTVETADEIQAAQAVLQVASRDEEIPYSRSILTDEYFPVTRRQMKQGWRYLRYLVREGPPSELDVNATVNKIGRQGILLEPVLIPRRVNRAELLLLIDQDGSMVPFHTLSRRLAETASRGGRLGRAGVYYFHNCPVEYLYSDSTHQKAEPIQDILGRLPHERTAVLIFSDAGAARSGFNLERIELTEVFLGQLKQHVRHIAWLNPMPLSRWLGTTAADIARLVPMFEMSRRGLYNAIDVLRGCSVPFEGGDIMSEMIE